MMNSENGTRSIKAEWRIIHNALHGRALKIRLGRRIYEIHSTKDGMRYIDYDNIRFCQQNRNARTDLGKRARSGERITWCTPHDRENEQPFVINQHVLLQHVNNAVIGVPIAELVKKGKDGKHTGRKTATGSQRMGKK